MIPPQRLSTPSLYCTADDLTVLYCSAEAATTNVRDGVPIGEKADSDWLYVVPWGMRRLLNYVNKRYHHPAIYITENGVDVPNENAIPFPQVLEDNFRINYYRVRPLHAPACAAQRRSLFCLAEGDCSG